MPRMVLCADFSLAAVAMLGLLNIACSNDRASTSHYSKAGPTAGAAFPDPEVKHPRRRQFLRFAVSGLAAAVFSVPLGRRLIGPAVDVDAQRAAIVLPPASTSTSASPPARTATAGAPSPTASASVTPEATATAELTPEPAPQPAAVVRGGPASVSGISPLIKAQRLLCGAAWEDHGLVFTNELGRPMEATNVRRRFFEPLLKCAGLPGIRFHDLRHTAATLLLGEGVHPKIVSERLGHSRVGITLDLYSHVTPTMQREAAAAVDTALRER